MMELAAQYAEPAACVVAWAIRCLVQSTLLICLALAACGFLRRRSTALRSAVLRITLLATLICPIAGSVCGLNLLDVSIPQGSPAAFASMSRGWISGHERGPRLLFSACRGSRANQDSGLCPGGA